MPPARQPTTATGAAAESSPSGVALATGNGCSARVVVTTASARQNRMEARANKVNAVGDARLSMNWPPAKVA